MWTEVDRETYKADGRRYPSDLTDAEWAMIAPLLSGYDPLTADLREMVNACLYLEKTGCPWRYLPTDFGPRPAVRTWSDRLRADGLWSEMAGLLTRAVRQKRGRRPEPSTGLLDAQSVACGPQAGERGTDGGKKVRGIKRHVLICSLGFVLASLVTAANVHDTQAAGWLWGWMASISGPSGGSHGHGSRQSARHAPRLPNAPNPNDVPLPNSALIKPMRGAMEPPEFPSDCRIISYSHSEGSALNDNQRWRTFAMSSGKLGYLLFGPYVEIPAGKYVALFAASAIRLSTRHIALITDIAIGVLYSSGEGRGATAIDGG